MLLDKATKHGLHLKKNLHVFVEKIKGLYKQTPKSLDRFEIIFTPHSKIKFISSQRRVISSNVGYFSN